MTEEGAKRGEKLILGIVFAFIIGIAVVFNLGSVIKDALVSGDNVSGTVAGEEPRL